MTSEEYVIWLKGFATAAGEFTLTPKQWDDLKDELEKVDDTPYVSDNFTIGPDGAYERDPNQFPFGTPNTAPNTQPFPTWQHPYYVDPYNPYKITCTPGTSNIGTITTTPGCSSITIANPPFGFGTTSTATSLPSGSTINYTTTNDKTLLND
jgi:hypothetical protein